MARVEDCNPALHTGSNTTNSSGAGSAGDYATPARYAPAPATGLQWVDPAAGRGRGRLPTGDPALKHQHHCRQHPWAVIAATAAESSTPRDGGDRGAQAGPADPARRVAEGAPQGPLSRCSARCRRRPGGKKPRSSGAGRAGAISWSNSQCSQCRAPASLWLKASAQSWRSRASES
jgi:hypothetical protein